MTPLQVPAPTPGRRREQCPYEYCTRTVFVLQGGIVRRHEISKGIPCPGGAYDFSGSPATERTEMLRREQTIREMYGWDPETTMGVILEET